MSFNHQGTYTCECGKTFTSSQSFNGHKSHCSAHQIAIGKDPNINKELFNKALLKGNKTAVEHQKLNKELRLADWVAEKHTCEKCGKVMTEKFGSGRFCSRQCANSRNFSDEAKHKKSVALKGRVCYSNGTDVICISEDETPPDGYVRGNFSITKNYTFEEFSHLTRKYIKNRKRIRKQSNWTVSKRVLESCKDYINSHNQSVIRQYETLLKEKASNKVELEFKDKQIYSKYYAVIDEDHPRQNAHRVFVHVLLAEQLLGRELNNNEVVHHKNENKLDNRFDNFYIFDTLNSHARFHNGEYYWLTIVNDTLKCDKVSFNDLEEFIKSNNS